MRDYYVKLAVPVNDIQPILSVCKKSVKVRKSDYFPPEYQGPSWLKFRAVVVGYAKNLEIGTRQH